LLSHNLFLKKKYCPLPLIITKKALSRDFSQRKFKVNLSASLSSLLKSSVLVKFQAKIPVLGQFLSTGQKKKRGVAN